MFEWLIDIVLPYRCISCRKYLKRSYLCSKCFNSLPVKKQSECVGCKRPTPDGLTCAFCKTDNPLDQLLIVSDFNDPVVAALIKKLKYAFIKEVTVPLAELSFKYLNRRAKRGRSFVSNRPLLVAVPLHPRRENWRGFNQAALIAELIAQNYQAENQNILERTSHRNPQAEIENRDQRLLNARDLYKCGDADKVIGRNIVLVDDVCTTGATLNECARVLKHAGAKSVAALVIARG